MIPIFIIVKDRIQVLKESIESYQQIATPYEIVVHDNNSTFPATVQYLKSLEENGVKVYRTRGGRNKNEELNSVSYSIEDYRKHREFSYYVVTDPDIALDAVRGDILDVYCYVLERMDIEVVGPMLRIDDIPDCYPQKQTVLKIHGAKYWGKEPSVLVDGKKTYRYVLSTIDTTFGLYRSSFKFIRKREGVRLLSPFSARHLDWYIDPANLLPDHVYYMQSAKFSINHWGKV